MSGIFIFILKTVFIIVSVAFFVLGFLAFVGIVSHQWYWDKEHHNK